MIQALLTEIVTILRTVFALSPSFETPNTQIVVGPALPVDDNTAFLSIETGALEVDQKGKDVASSSPRPSPYKEELPTAGLGPYPLSRIPLEGTSAVRLIYPAGNTRLLDARKDYQIDFNSPSITLQGVGIPGNAVSIEISYSYVGVFSLQNFSQSFALHAYGPTIAEAESWMSVALTAIITNQDDLLASFNNTQYNLGDYTTVHSLSGLSWLKMGLDKDSSPERLTATFMVQGQLKHVKEISDGFGLIEQILSPTAFVEGSTDAVDIRPNVD
ncbi:MAG: hypothetical protein AAGC85_03925 [Bacteroidota bacterium]